VNEVNFSILTGQVEAEMCHQQHTMLKP